MSREAGSRYASSHCGDGRCCARGTVILAAATINASARTVATGRTRAATGCCAGGFRFAPGDGMNVKVLITALIVGSALPTFAGQRVSLRVTPAIAFAPANLIVRATVELNKDNRAIEIIAESENFYRSSEVALDGEQAPRVTLMQFKSLPGGDYHVRA